MDLNNAKLEFKSAVDPWFYWLIAVIGTLVAVLMYPLTLSKGLPGLIMLVVAILLAVSVPLWVMLSTRYTITNEYLIVKFGAFHWTIAISDITSVRRTRALMRGPAFSIDSLEIHYGPLNSIMVSPRERDRFMKALGVGTRLRGWG